MTLEYNFMGTFFRLVLICSSDPFSQVQVDGTVNQVKLGQFSDLMSNLSHSIYEYCQITIPINARINPLMASYVQ